MYACLRFVTSKDARTFVHNNKNTIVFFSNMTYIIHYNKTCALFFFNISKQSKSNATHNIYKRLN